MKSDFIYNFTAKDLSEYLQAGREALAGPNRRICLPSNGPPLFSTRQSDWHWMHGAVDLTSLFAAEAWKVSAAAESETWK